MRPLVLLSLSLSLAWLCAASGCSSASDEDALVTGEVGALVPFQSLLSTNASCHGTEPGEATLRDDEAWRRWWAESSCGQGEPPAVDFAASLVLGVQDREGPTGCYRLRIAEVLSGVGGGYRVVVNRHVPERSTPCPMVVVHPAVAVRVPAVRGPVDFEWVTVEGPPPHPESGS